MRVSIATARCAAMFAVLMFSATAYSNQIFFELPFSLKTKDSSVCATQIRPGVGFGMSHNVVVQESAIFGYSALVLVYPRLKEGSDRVFSKGIELDLESNVFLALPISGTTISIFPYVFLGPNFEMRIVSNTAYLSTVSNFRMDLGMRGGLGLKLGYREWFAKMEGGGGYATYGYNLKVAINFGFGIF